MAEPEKLPAIEHATAEMKAMIDFRSDNTGRAAPEMLEALVRANHGTALGYGADDWTAALQQRFSELFETNVRVFPVATGTAASFRPPPKNPVALASAVLMCATSLQ